MQAQPNQFELRYEHLISGERPLRLVKATVGRVVCCYVFWERSGQINSMNGVHPPSVDEADGNVNNQESEGDGSGPVQTNGVHH